MTLATSLLAGLLSLSATLALAHGEDKPGPHGGLIKMPGAYHTEVLKLSKNQLKVYLLDIHWKNPSVRDSSVKVKLTGSKTAEADCKVEAKAYLCTFDASVDLDSPGQLHVTSEREKQRGAVVQYSTPLKL